METGKNDEMLRQDFQLSHNRDPYFRTMEFHAHDFLELYYFLDGSVTYYIEDQVYDLCPGDLLIVSAVLAFTFIVPIAGAVCIAILFVVRIICFFQVCSGKAKDAAIIGKLPFLK